MEIFLTFDDLASLSSWKQKNKNICNKVREEKLYVLIRRFLIIQEMKWMINLGHILPWAQLILCDLVTLYGDIELGQFGGMKYRNTTLEELS